MKRREFITLSAARRLRGRWRRGRSSRRNCRPSDSWARPRLRSRANGSPHSKSGYGNSVGSRVAPSQSSIDGRRDAPSAIPRSRPSSSGSRSMSLSRGHPHQSSRQSRLQCSSRSCSLRRWTRLAPASSRAWRAPAATLLACRSSRPILPASVSSFCARLSAILAGWRSWQCRRSRRRFGDAGGSGNGPYARPRSHHPRNPTSGGYRARH